MCFPRTKNAFTLIELLVVIAIIAILMAILLPGLNNARKMAIRTQCVSNVKNIGTALVSYCDDKSGLLPLINAGGFTEAYSGSRVLSTFSDYLGKNLRVLYCPTNRKITYTGPTSSFWGYRGKFTGEKLTKYTARAYYKDCIILDTSYPSWGDGRYVNHQNGYYAEGQSQWFADAHAEYVLRRQSGFIGE